MTAPSGRLTINRQAEGWIFTEAICVQYTSGIPNLLSLKTLIVVLSHTVNCGATVVDPLDKSHKL